MSRDRNIDHWDAEDVEAWESGGNKIARRNLIWSIFAEHVGFSIWSIWSVMVLFMPQNAYHIDAAGKFYLVAMQGHASGDIKACWIICTNPVATVANRKIVITGLEAAELVITQDAYQATATDHYADIVLPATLWAESDAVMVNSERNLTLLQASIPPAGQARPDWQLICQVAAHMGFGEDFDFSSSEQVFDEIRRFSNPKTGYDLRGVSYARLRQTPLQWPCPPDDDRDRHPIRYLNDGVSQDLFVDADGHRPRLAFPTPSRRAVFHARPHMDPHELPDDDFPLVLNTGRLQHQWHTMTKTGKVARPNKLDSGPFVEIHPSDASRSASSTANPSS